MVFYVALIWYTTVSIFANLVKRSKYPSLTKIEYRIFDSSLGAWRNPKNPPPSSIDWAAVSVDRMLYLYSKYSILAFDMETEKWEIIERPIPASAVRYSAAAIITLEWDGVLSVAHIHWGTADSWVLTQDMRWVKAHNLQQRIRKARNNIEYSPHLLVADLLILSYSDETFICDKYGELSRLFKTCRHQLFL
ncbi:hypothetical protein AMTR_s00044p00127630 [Amborella trichopoda]|uniref:F-box associated domain-containing protein n=1 Tax=Amborella trichopoda TaxID=13333 RepID=U5D6V6_AMBTC|nr:hypothetical protein AMTR_s00044p00127630 [Amborella trichopoda]